MFANNSTGSNNVSSSSCFTKGHIVHPKTNQLVPRTDDEVEEEWIKNLTKFLQLMKISSVEIADKSLSNVSYKPSLNRDILLSFYRRCSNSERSNDRQLKSPVRNNNTWRFNRKVMRTTTPFPEDVTLIDLIEFTGKSAQMIDWTTTPTKKTNGNEVRLTAHPHSQSRAGSNTIKQNPENSNANDLSYGGSRKDADLSSQIAKNDGDVVDCFTYYANTILPQRHGTPEESEFSNGIIKEINQLYWKYKNFNILEGRLSLEQVRSNIIRNLSKRKLYQMMQKCKFTCLEDCILLVSFEKQTLKDFTSADCNVISYFMPWRSERVIKRRLEILLKPINTQFTIAEDRLLLKAVEILGQNWNEICKLMRSEKSRRACRSRYNLLIRILRKQTLEEWYQKCRKGKSPPVMLTGQILKVFCAFSYVLSNWELVEPLGLSDFKIESPPHDDDLKRYLRSFDFSVVRQAKENFRDRMHKYFELMTCKSKNYVYEKMKFERKIPQSWAAALYLRDIELKPIWDIETPSRFELAIYYYYHQNYSKDTVKKSTRSLMPSYSELLAYPEVSNIIDKEAFQKNIAPCVTQVYPEMVLHAHPKSEAITMHKQSDFRKEDMESEEEEESTDTDSASDWETLSDDESSSDGESVSDTATVSDWDTFSDTESCSDSDVGASDSDYTPQLDEACHAELCAPLVASGKPENVEAEWPCDSDSQIICFRDIELREEMRVREELETSPNPAWIDVFGEDEDETKAQVKDAPSARDLAALDLVLLDHDYCQSYTYSFKNSKLKTTADTGIPGGFRKVPKKCFQNVKQQVTQHNSSLQTTEGKRYRKRAHRTLQTTSSDKHDL